MRSINFSSLFALVLLAAGCTEAKFAPTTFVAKHRRANDHDVKDFLRTDESPSTKSLSTRGGGLSLPAILTPALSYYADVFFAVATAIFTAFWLISKSFYDNSIKNGTPYPDNFPNFNEMVLRDGFCINKKFLGIGTLPLCGLADLSLVVLTYFFNKDRIMNDEDNKKVFMASAGYTLLHGAIHVGPQSTGPIWDPNGQIFMNVLGVGLLAVITAFTPIGIKKILADAGKNEFMALVTGVAAWIGFVALYVFGIKDKNYALTYINISIYLSIFGARALALKKDDPERLKFWSGKIALLGPLMAAVNIIVMCFEPFACNSWFGEIGGHLWFDVSLWFFMMSILK